MTPRAWVGAPEVAKARTLSARLRRATGELDDLLVQLTRLTGRSESLSDFAARRQAVDATLRELIAGLELGRQEWLDATTPPVDREEAERPRFAPGALLEPGVNVDRINIAAGLRSARALGYDDEQAIMVAEYSLQRWARGEEAGADRTWLTHFPRDLTSWRVIVACARGEAERQHAAQVACDADGQKSPTEET